VLTSDRRHLLTEAYPTEANLAARQAIYAYQVPPFDFPVWALDQVDWTGVRVVADIGSGNGLYVRRLAGTVPAVLGLDISHGMLGDLRRNQPGSPVRLAVADAQDLPLASSSVDAAMAMHMLFHVPDIGRAIREIRRALRPGGPFLASTNARHHLVELYDLLGDAVAEVGGDRGALVRNHERFGPDDGLRLLRGVFGQVEWRAAASVLAIPDVAPIMQYFEAVASFFRGVLTAGVAWEECMVVARRMVVERGFARGPFRVSAESGVFVCR
jgi:SAM-dependent methyltransferase